MGTDNVASRKTSDRFKMFPYWSETCQNAASATGNGTAIDVSGFSSVTMQISGTFVGTITFEGTLDGTNWVSLQGVNIADGTISTTATAPGIFQVPCAGLAQVRARLTWTSGTSCTVKAVTVTFAPGTMLADVDIQGSEAVAATLQAGTALVGKVGIDQTTPGTTNRVDIGTIAAGETHLGEVSGSTIRSLVTPTITAGAYSANDVFGGIQTISLAARINAGYVTLQSLVITDLAMQSFGFQIYFFTANPGTGSYADNAAFDIDDTDMALCVGALSSSSGQWINAADNGVFILNNIGMVMASGAGSKNIFALVKLTGTPTFASTSDVTFKYAFYRD